MKTIFTALLLCLFISNPAFSSQDELISAIRSNTAEVREQNELIEKQNREIEQVNDTLFKAELARRGERFQKSVSDAHAELDAIWAAKIAAKNKEE